MRVGAVGSFSFALPITGFVLLDLPTYRAVGEAEQALYVVYADASVRGPAARAQGAALFLHPVLGVGAVSLGPPKIVGMALVEPLEDLDVEGELEVSLPAFEVVAQAEPRSGGGCLSFLARLFGGG